jgi:hypothetical protein
MSPLKTIYRLVVMIAAGVIVVKGWQLYGPPAEKVKAFAVSAVEMAQSAWNKSQPEPTPPVDDPRPQAAQLVANEPDVSGDTAPLFAGAGEPVTAPALQAVDQAPAEPAGGQTTDATAAAPGSDVLPQLLARLEAIGGAKPELGEWGSSGNLYRCSCRAHLAGSVLARHFEAVAHEPVAAVEQVVASVEAWQSERQHLSP